MKKYFYSIIHINQCNYDIIFNEWQLSVLLSFYMMSNYHSVITKHNTVNTAVWQFEDVEYNMAISAPV